MSDHAGPSQGQPLPATSNLGIPDNSMEHLISSPANSSIQSVAENAQREDFKSRSRRRSSFGTCQERAPRQSIYVSSEEPLAKKLREAVFEVVEDSTKKGLVPGKCSEADSRIAALEKYLSSVEEENEDWKKLLSERKKDYKEAKQRLAAVEKGNKSHNATSLLKEEDKKFLGTRPNYEAMSNAAVSEYQQTALQSFEKYAKAHKLRKDVKKNESLLKTARQQLIHSATRDVHDPKAVIQSALQPPLEEG